MSEKEGVIKYDINYVESTAQDFQGLSELNAWRKIFFLLNFIGQDPQRYDGLGYGNVSCRLTTDTNNLNNDDYIISGTQTGHLPDLDNSHYTLVIHCDISQNLISATGPIKPSSEALTHGAIYQADKDTRFVFHVHSPIIWEKTKQLNIIQTRENVLYGTPEMAKELTRLMSGASSAQDHIICMTEHRDGIISYGKTAEEAGLVLIAYYSLALQL